MNEIPPQPTPPTFHEALRFWWKLGWISFGGPAGQIAIMHREVVERRRWLSEEHFLHALNFCMLLPGPEAQQLAIYLGWRLHGARGGIAAGALFVIPSIFILTVLSWIFMTGGQVPWIAGIFHGLSAAVIAIVAGAVKRIGSRALKTPALWALAIAAFVAIFFLGVSFLWIILAAAAIGAIGGKAWPVAFRSEPAPGLNQATGDAADCIELPAMPKASLGRTAKIIATCVTLWLLPILAAGIMSDWQGVHFREGVFFGKTALITFGGAYAVLPYVAQVAVEQHGWLSQSQMMAGLGLAETTPGPLIMVLQFVGFATAWQHPGSLSAPLAAVLGGLITTWSTFLPCFLFVFLGAPHVESLRQRPALRAVLNAITASVVGVMLNLALWFALHAIHPQSGRYDLFVAITAVLSLFVLERRPSAILPVLAGCGLAGFLWSFTS